MVLLAKGIGFERGHAADGERGLPTSRDGFGVGDALGELPDGH